MPDRRRSGDLAELAHLDPAADLALDDATINDALHRLTTTVDQTEVRGDARPDFEVSDLRRPRPRTKRRRRFTMVFAGTVVVAAVALTVTLLVGLRSDDVPTSGSPAVTAAARALLDSWTAAHPASARPELVVTGELTAQEGDWIGDDKVAFIGGLINVAPDVAVTGMPDTTIQWSDGLTAPAEPLSPAAALTQLNPQHQSFPEVPPLVVTAATATTLEVKTTLGSATVPAWAMTLQGSAVKIIVVAAKVTQRQAIGISEPGSELHGPGQETVRIDDVTVSSDGRSVTAHFVGSPGPASEPCGEDYSAEVVANDAAAVIIVYRHPYVTDTATPCLLGGAERTASAALDSTWNGRPFLDFYSGQPLTVN